MFLGVNAAVLLFSGISFMKKAKKFKEFMLKLKEESKNDIYDENVDIEKRISNKAI